MCEYHDGQISLLNLFNLIQTNILSGNSMTNSMQATLSKAAIYSKQQTRE